MARTTFKSVGGTSKPAVPATPSTKSAKARKATPKTTKPSQASAITISGEGTVPIYGDGAMRRVPRGEPIPVSDAERAYLDRAGIPYA